MDQPGALGQTIVRGMAVLRAFRSDRSPLTNAELVRRTGLSKATVSRMTSTLVQLGYLRPAPGRRGFELAAGALGVGHAYLETSELVRVVQPYLEQLVQRLEVSAALAVPDGLDMVNIAYSASAAVATLRLGVGSMLPMAKSAIGRAYLWSLPANEQQGLLARLRQQAGEQGDAIAAGLRTSFAELEATGVCCVASAVLRDTFGFALPLRLGRQGVRLAMSCGRAACAPDLQAERRRIEPVLRQTAAEMQRDLAHVDALP